MPFCRFSALQRAENSSMVVAPNPSRHWPPFQCSSASRKFLNTINVTGSRTKPRTFQCSSASRKFLNYRGSLAEDWVTTQFQCSSASRKFLNTRSRERYGVLLPVSVLFSEPKIPQSWAVRRWSLCDGCFSALQRAENSSISSVALLRRHWQGFSALQRAENSSIL